MDPTVFENQLGRTEGPSIDFKRTQYDFSGASKSEKSEKRAKFVKDLLCMWNTPRDEPAYLVLGVESQPNGSKILHGVNGHIDDAELRQKLDGWVFPLPNFHYQPIQHNGHEFAVLVIPPDPATGPCLPVLDVGDGLLRKHQVYCRRGSQNVEANQAEQHAIYQWFQQASAPAGLPDTGDVAWDALLDAMHHFEPDYYFILAASPLAPAPGMPLKNLGRLGWAWVADFDPESDRSGLLHECRPAIEAHRTLHTVVKGNRVSPNIDRGTYWYYASGMAGLQATLVNGPWVAWKQAYDHDVRQQLLALAKAGLQKPFVLLVIWHDDTLGPYLEVIIDATVSAIGPAVQIAILCPVESVEIRRLEQRYGARVITMPLHHACHGFGALQAPGTPAAGTSCEVPSASGAPISIEGKDYYWISEELDIVDLRSGRSVPTDRVLGRDFLRGYEISWNELGLRYDVDRDLTDQVQKTVEANLSKRRALRVNLYHMPGAGGTTVARRILWNLHRKFPCVLLRRTEPGETAERVAMLVALTGLPVLAVIDAGAISDREMDALYEVLAARQLPVVVLQVIRRFSPGDPMRSSFLSAVLSPDELGRFVHFLSREAPAKSNELAQAAASANKNEHTPFYMSLLAFGRDFVGLDKYVRGRLQNLGASHARVVVYLALAHYYGQRTVPAQAFADLLQLPPERSVDLARALHEETRELLVNAEPGRWRTAHPLVAEACLSQLLAPGVSEPNVWKQRLSDWAKEFITFCRGTLPVPAEAELDLAERVFVYRDNSELLGTERAGSAQFAQIIEDIPSDEGRLEVLRHLTAVFPENAHFWAHLGRFYSMKMKEFSQAVGAIDQALNLQPDDNTLHHMKGMALRNEAYESIAARRPLTEVVRKAEDSARSFAEARRLDPEDEYGYISDTQMIIRVLDYAGSFHDGDAMRAATHEDAPSWLRQSVQTAEDLLDQVRRNHPGESPSDYEERCRAGLSALYGDHDAALQRWGNVLNRKDVYAPPIRRQMVWTYLARRRRKWAELTPKDIRRVVELLGQNMDQEPQEPRNLRLWLEAIRHIQPAPTLESVIEKLVYWKASTGGLEPTYYLYVMYALKTIPSGSFAGSTLARDQARRALEECRGLARNRRNRTKSFEWLGPGEGLERLVRQERLGSWNLDTDFWADSSPLLRIGGVISRIYGPEAGEIEIGGGLTAFFVPGRSSHMKGRSENSPVSCFIGFSYDGLRAWSVQDQKE
jgi:tetratricopeptide (TPR) repeat protein